MMKAQEKSLGELLRQAGKITARQIQVALAEQKKTHDPIGKVFVRMGFVGERDILQVMQGMMVLTFRIENEYYGIETFRTREVMKYAPLDPFPEPQDPWEGFFHLRGEVVPALSFRKVLGLGPPPQEKGTWFIVLERKSSPFILWVDHVKEVARLKVEQIEPLPPYLLGRKTEIYYCLARVKDDLYSILNPDKLIEENQNLLPPSEVQYADPT
jgi:chemotaxis signal transduction protein